MKIDTVKRFVALRESLLREKAGLETRLAQLNQALEVNRTPAQTQGIPVGRTRQTRPKIKNKMSLRQAIIEVTKAKPLTRKEILGAIHKIGYKFSTNDPMNSLGSVLYSKKQFKNANGKFSPA